MKPGYPRWIAWSVALVAVTVVLSAQEGGESPMPGRRNSDASADRNLLVPSAETIPAKSWAFNSYELFLAGFTYGISDDLQASVTGTLPLFKSQPLLLSASLKDRLLHGRNFIFSLQGGMQLMGGGSVDGRFSASLGTFFDFAADKSGDLTVSLALQGFVNSTRVWEYVGRYEWREYRKTTLSFLPSLGANLRASRRVRLFAEVLLPDLGKEGNFYTVEGLPNLCAYGLRFCSGKIAVDLSFIRPLADWDADFLLLGIPYLTFSVRW